MRKLTVSFVTLTSLTACSQGNNLGDSWSFELPDSLANDQQFARFGEQLAAPGFDQLAMAMPDVDSPQPKFANQPALTRRSDSEVEFNAEKSSAVDGQASSASAEPGLTAPERENSASDLSLNELGDINFPQRRPRPDPLSQVRFSPAPATPSHRQLNRLLSAAPKSFAPVQVKQPIAAPATLLASPRLTEGNHVRNNIGGPDLPFPSGLGFGNDNLPALPPVPAEAPLSLIGNPAATAGAYPPPAPQVSVEVTHGMASDEIPAL